MRQRKKESLDSKIALISMDVFAIISAMGLTLGLIFMVLNLQFEPGGKDGGAPIEPHHLMLIEKYNYLNFDLDRKPEHVQLIPNKNPRTILIRTDRGILKYELLEEVTTYSKLAKFRYDNTKLQLTKDIITNELRKCAEFLNYIDQ